MPATKRLEQIVSLVEDQGFISVKELSKLCNVSEVTIRRDLQRLDEEKRLRRTHGGAVSLRPAFSPGPAKYQPPSPPPQSEGFLTDRVDVLIATSFDPHSNGLLLDRTESRNIPVIAESVGMSGVKTLVALDNYQAARALGRWAGHYAQQHFEGQAYVLDLTYHLKNTQARSLGFMAGLGEVLPMAQTILSINAQSGHQTAYQLTIDTLNVYPIINIIFAINDSTAWGAIQACQDMRVNPDSLLVLTFGLEGETLKNALMTGEYCKAGLAMFPEIVGPVCIEAAINAYNDKPMAKHLATPHAVLTPETLPQFYTKSETGWHINWSTVDRELEIPLSIDKTAPRTADTLPRRIGFVVPFSEHEWYKNLITCMQAHADHLKIELEVVDADQTLKDEVALRRREIAQTAAEQVQPGDVLLIDGGQLTICLAEQLTTKENITVITNSIPVFDILRDRPNITLISTGGMLRHSSETLIGSTAEAALRELRADKLFLAVTGISLNFGLSHTNPAEVAMKQAMIRAAREVILLADHTRFQQESVVQVAPANVVNKLITDNALPASTRLDLTKLGLEIIIARV
ncbi:MAG: substrate-binding domain-containing protein [Anaerolineae bacterium]